MSCSCCCCVTPSAELLDGIRKKERLVRRREEEQEEEEQEEESRRNMDISVLREQYRCTRETQKRHTQVLLFRTVSDELVEAVSIVPVTQGLTSPWEPSSSSPPAVTFDPDLTTCDPWHVHLGLHRRCAGVAAQLTASSPETTNTNSSSRHSSSSSESVFRKLSVDSTSDSPCSSFCSTKEEDQFTTDRSRADPDTGSSHRSRADPDTGCSDRSRADPDTGSSHRSRADPEKMDPIQVSVSGPFDASEQNPSNGSKEDHPVGSLSDPQDRSAAGSDGSSTPVASVTCSPSSSTTSLHEDQNPSAGRTSSNCALQTGSTSTWRGSRKFSAPALRFTRQLSVGGVGFSTGTHQNQNYHPFPNRKTPRISEAARRLGMYSSF